MKRQIKTASREQEQAARTPSQHTSAREFATVEEALREDRAGVSVPPAVEQRLSQSIANLPKPGRPWWKRFLG
jgi:hypothetical protein